MPWKVGRLGDLEVWPRFWKVDRMNREGIFEEIFPVKRYFRHNHRRYVLLGKGYVCVMSPSFPLSFSRFNSCYPYDDLFEINESRPSLNSVASLLVPDKRVYTLCMDEKPGDRGPPHSRKTYLETLLTCGINE